MLEKKISSLLITNSKEEVVGILTTDDLLYHLATLLKDEETSHEPFVNVTKLQTVGEVANELSLMGI
jgi:CBS domain-containing protein